jgi:hypothetical protein
MDDKTQNQTLKKHEQLLSVRLEALFNSGLRASNDPDVSYRQFLKAKAAARAAVDKLIAAEVAAAIKELNAAT